MRHLEITLAAALIVCAGCFTSSTPQDWASKLTPGGKDEDAKKPKGTPKLDVVGQSLGNSQEISLSPDNLLTRVAALIAEQRFTSAARVVQRHPDAALEWLRTNGTAPDPEVAKLVARVHDRQCLAPDALQTWDALTAERVSDPAKFQEYREARKRFQSALSQGQIDHAFKQNLVELAAGLKSPLIEIDALQLEGTAYVLSERPVDGAATFERAVAAASRVSPYQTTYLLLLLSDAQRRTGDGKLANETWSRAVATAGRLLIAEHPALDPVLWERLGYLRPIEVQWPLDVVHQLHRADTLPGIDLPDVSTVVASDRPVHPAVAETVIWNAIGHWYLDRNHSQAALVSFKRAESAAPTNKAQQWLRLRQARALIQLDQNGPATAILVSLAGDKSSSASLPAFAVLGSLRLKSGQVQQGLGLLRKSAERETLEWPERGEAEADLGAAFLMSGDKVEGLRHLHQAQQQFTAMGDFEGLILALENEALFLENSDGKSQAPGIRARISELERTAR
ncbi:MAG: hypothetical protein C0483_19245 [Pirellula sp.]|nr:hypothetical protein [Pirellula sp.]